MTIGSGTNEERMVRQGEFMRKAIQQMNKKISEDLSFGEELLKTLEGITTTNMITKRLAENAAVEWVLEHLYTPAD